MSSVACCWVPVGSWAEKESKDSLTSSSMVSFFIGFCFEGEDSLTSAPVPDEEAARTVSLCDDASLVADLDFFHGAEGGLLRATLKAAIVSVCNVAFFLADLDFFPSAKEGLLSVSVEGSMLGCDADVNGSVAFEFFFLLGEVST